MGLHFDLETSSFFISNVEIIVGMHIPDATKLVRLISKYMNRKLVIVRVALDMFKFNVIVAITSIYDVEMVHFDGKWLLLTLSILYCYVNLKRLLSYEYKR